MLVQKYAHEINIKATLRPLQKIYNHLCGPALEFSHKKKKKLKDQRNYAKCTCAVHAPPSTTAKVMHVSLSGDSADFILIDFDF